MIVMDMQKKTVSPSPVVTNPGARTGVDLECIPYISHTNPENQKLIFGISQPSHLDNSIPQSIKCKSPSSIKQNPKIDYKYS